jgi:hypothetical protein
MSRDFKKKLILDGEEKTIETFKGEESDEAILQLK